MFGVALADYMYCCTYRVELVGWKVKGYCNQQANMNNFRCEAISTNDDREEGKKIMKNISETTKNGHWITVISGAVALLTLGLSGGLLFTEVSHEPVNDKMIDAAVVLFSVGFFALLIAAVSYMMDRNFMRTTRDVEEAKGVVTGGVPVVSEPAQ